MSPRTRIDGHPGFYRERRRIYFQIRDRRGRRVWHTAATIKEAERRKIQLEDEVDRGEYRERSRDTFESYARSWIVTFNGRTSRGIRETTRDDYRRRLEQHAIPFFGRMRLSEIELRDVKEYAVKLAEGGLAPNTVRLAVAPVRALFATALEEGAIRSNPVVGLRLPQRQAADGDEDDEGQVKAMSEDALRAVLDQIAVDAPDWLLFFRVLAWSGMRRSEILELRWKDVDLGERIVHVRRAVDDKGRIGPPKTKYGRRRLRLTPELARSLWTHRGTTGDEELVFRNRRGGRVDPSNLMQRVLKPAAVEAGLGEWVAAKRDGRKTRAESWVGLHTFRHTCATILFRRGWNAVQVQRWCGHHKPSFTLDTYVHLLDEDVPEPTFFDQLAGAAAVGTEQTLSRVGRNGLAELSQASRRKPAISTTFPAAPKQAETL